MKLNKPSKHKLDYVNYPNLDTKTSRFFYVFANAMERYRILITASNFTITGMLEKDLLLVGYNENECVEDRPDSFHLNLNALVMHFTDLMVDDIVKDIPPNEGLLATRDCLATTIRLVRGIVGSLDPVQVKDYLNVLEGVPDHLWTLASWTLEDALNDDELGNLNRGDKS